MYQESHPVVPPRRRPCAGPAPLATGPGDRRLRDRQRDQLRITRQRRPALPGRDPILVSEDVRCNDKGFQIRHLELPSRGDTGLEALRLRRAGPCEPTRVPFKPLGRRRRRPASAACGLALVWGNYFDLDPFWVAAVESVIAAREGVPILVQDV